MTPVRQQPDDPRRDAPARGTGSDSAPSNPSGPPADAPIGPGVGEPEDGRLNLLVSYAGWELESWIDRLPRLLNPMGVRAIRAGTGREATDFIRTHPVHIAVVDLGLPLDVANPAEEGGRQLLELLRRLDQPPPTVVVKRRRTHRDDTREIHAALRAGAFAVVDRPADPRGMETMLEVLRRALCRYYANRWPLGQPPGPCPS